MLSCVLLLLLESHTATCSVGVFLLVESKLEDVFHHIISCLIEGSIDFLVHKWYSIVGR